MAKPEGKRSTIKGVAHKRGVKTKAGCSEEHATAYKKKMGKSKFGKKESKHKKKDKKNNKGDVDEQVSRSSTRFYPKTTSIDGDSINVPRTAPLAGDSSGSPPPPSTNPNLQIQTCPPLSPCRARFANAMVT